MADSVRASCAAPVFKRPRLEFSTCENDALISYESVSSEERFSIDSGLQEELFECLSNECPPGSATSPSEQQQHTEFSDVAPACSVEEEEDQDSTLSELSGLSELSSMSDESKPNPDENSWLERQRSSGVDPRLLLSEILPEGAKVPAAASDGLLWRYILHMLHSPPPRTKLSHVNTLQDVVQLLRTCTRIVVLTGAGVSVSCGIPDFRSRNGIYARLSTDYPDLPDPQAMFDINYFRKDPRPFFKFAKEIYPGQFTPSPSHRFLRLLERQERLLRNYTQNIDTLEKAAGISRLITCHGSFATATCTVCRHRVDSSVIKEDIFNQTIPYCVVCGGGEERGIMKPDIVFFGEGLSDEFHSCLEVDKAEADLLVVIGSSLKVRPVAMIPSSIPPEVPQILINREPLNHLTFDVELLGDCDIIIGELCNRLKEEWSIEEDIPCLGLSEMPYPPPEENNNLAQGEESNSCGLSAMRLEDNVRDTDEKTVNTEEERGHYFFFPPSRYLFPGAEDINEEEGEEEDSCSTTSDPPCEPPAEQPPSQETHDPSPP